MPPYVLLAALAVVASVPLLWWSVAGERAPTRGISANLFRHGITDARQLHLTGSATERVVQPSIGWLASRARRLTPLSWIEKLDHRLALGGRPAAWTLERVLAAKLLLALAGAAGGFLVFADERTAGKLLLWAGMAAGGYFLPDLLLHNGAQKRRTAIGLALPDTLDQMTIAVEAGLGFESAMAHAGRTGEGPLAEELVRTLQEMQVGVDRSTAFRNLAERTGDPELRRFVHAVVQAERYGIPVADVLRTQAAEQRSKRRQRAEERAMKIPVKIIFPVVLCILPTLFIVIIGPAAIRIMRAFSGLG
ncbi:MAG: type II secretion system F family protein [Actinomycetota bacterium]|nr:type II secretion system F family protein [Actinomycetota bacterium]